MTPQIMDTITEFNALYKLPVEYVPTLDNYRISQFTHTLQEELNEANAITFNYANMQANKTNGEDHQIDQAYKTDAEALADIADWLGDVIVYCLSEGLKYGLDMKKVLEIIMDSNMSKLGSDGQPIYDSVGKVIKGPNYWKPEPKLQAYIQGEIDALGAVASKVIATTVASILPMGGVTESTPTP